MKMRYFVILTCLLALLTLNVSGCGAFGGSAGMVINTPVAPADGNFRVVKENVMGQSTFRIGNISSKGYGNFKDSFAQAMNNLIETADLQDNQILVNITTTRTMKKKVFFSNVVVTISADVLEFVFE